MRKQRLVAAKKLTKQDVPLPDWYWKRGLHDAKILSVCELEFAPDWKEKRPKRNCLEIQLDSKNALFEQDIETISLYNYRIKEMKTDTVTPVTLDAFQKTYWMGDRIEQLSDKRYLLEIACVDLHFNHLSLTIEFEFPAIQRS